MKPAPARIFVSAGEVSGDLILGRILAGLRARFPDLDVRGLGGDASAREGLRPLFPLIKTAVSGAGDVLRAARFCLGLRSRALRELEAFRPDLVLLVDYPGLNLRLAARARALGLPVYYVAPPQAWAYRHPGRKLRRAGRALAGAAVHVLFPFEAESYAAFAGKVTAGHFLADPGNLRDTGGGGLLLCPGSRLQVLRRNLPAWLRALEAAGKPAGAPGGAGISVLVPGHLLETARALAGPWNRRLGNIQVTSEKDAALDAAGRALAFPGTITLELALRGVPTAVAAVLDPLTLALGRRLLRGTRLALPNLLLGEAAVPEWAGTGKGFGAREAERLWQGLDDREGRWGDLQIRLRKIIGPSRGAEVAARECAQLLSKA